MKAMILSLALVLVSTGCASVATNRYLQGQQNPVAIGATESGVTIAVDLFSLDVVRAHPWATAGAALVDVAAVFGTYHVAEKQGWVGSRSGGGSKGGTKTITYTQTSESGDNTRIDIRGDGNIVTLTETHNPPPDTVGTTTP